jgi:hypothetical protein
MMGVNDFAAGDYHGARLKKDPKRSQVWATLWRYFFSKRIHSDYTVLDLGAGHGDFINNVQARRRIAVDQWKDLPSHVDQGVEPEVRSVTDLDFLKDESIDYAFASNLFEHLPQTLFIETLAKLSKKLSQRGTLTIVQPNYRYAYREYFDDYTHIAVYSHISLADLLVAHGWEILEMQARFLPLTVKSRLPSWPFLIGFYLSLPFKPLAKQMLLVARPRSA